MTLSLTCAAVFCAIVCLSEAAKILVLPLSQMSHIASLLSIADELGKRGHDVHMMMSNNFSHVSTANKSVTFISDFLPMENQVSVEEKIEDFVNQLLEHKPSFQSFAEAVNRNCLNFCSQVLTNIEPMYPQLDAIKFDIAIVDAMFVFYCNYLIAHRLRIPWITYTDYPNPSVMGTPWLPSHVPHHYSRFNEKMSFVERCRNTFLNVFLHFYSFSANVPEQFLDKYREYGDFSSLDDFSRRSKLFLVTSDVVLDYVKPMTPNIVQIGGITTSQPRPLPGEFKDFLDGAETGAIVVSFGSMLSKYPLEIAKKFASAFSRLDNGYRVVWRLVNSENITLSSNVKISAWLPQNDILGHDKIKLFISHCGNNGQFEAIYNGVPMLCFPIVGDQSYNAIRVEYKEFGLAMDLLDFTADQLLSNIITILSDPRYHARVSHASEIFRSSPERPVERAARWVEHVIQFGGDHLRPHGLDLTPYQYWMLDILAIVGAAVVTVLLIAKCLLVRIIRLLRSPAKRKNKAE